MRMRDRSAGPAIRRMLVVRAAALSARDADAVRQACGDAAPRGRLELASAVPWLPSGARDRADLEAWFAGFEGRIESWLVDLRITAADPVAAVCHVHRIRGRRPGGRAVDLALHATACLQRRPHGWILLGHYSRCPPVPGRPANPLGL